MSWHITGQYAETCNCDYLCPCPITGLAKTTHGYCDFAMGFEVKGGEFDGMTLAGRKFVVIAHTPGAMSAGNWRVGLIVDDQADDGHVDALTKIVTGEAGGPMANLSPMFGEFLGVERQPISIEGSGGSWSVKAGKMLDQALEGVSGLGGQQLYLENAGHPASNKLALATAKRSHLHAFGIDWDQDDGKNNGHFAPFDWRG